jgi:dynein heavy chain, axonemal
MRGVKPARVKDASGKMVEEYWGPALKLLGDSHFLQELKDYDRDNIDPKVIEKIRNAYTSNPDFNPEIVKNSSSAAEGLCKWVCALDKYESVAKIVAPKTAALKNAEEELATEMAKLQVKQAELKEVEDKINLLENQFKEMSDKMKSLEYQADQCEKKLERAEKLLGGLGGEKSRWTTAAEISRVRYINLTGDILLGSGIIAYLGAFTGVYRQRCIKIWTETCAQAEIPSGSNFNLASVLGDPIQTRDWIINGLPNDTFSVENSIIANVTRRFPLFIDVS